MASSSLGTLTYDLVAKIGGFTAGLSAAEREAKKSADAINKQIESIGVAGYAVGNALGSYLRDGIDLAINAFPALIDKAAQFQDIADKTGGSAVGFANFAVSAKVAGVTVDELADAAVKLTKNLTGLDDESKAAGAALTAIGISIEDFKKLRPDEQIKAVAQAFGEFDEGAGKTAVALDLFGKSGANVLKFLKDYQEAGGDVNILTAEQIKRADDYGDAQARARAQLELYASAAATEAIPAITALTSSVKDVIKEMLGAGDAANGLAANDGVRTFAENAVSALAFVVDAVQGVKVAFERTGEFIGATAAATAAAVKLDFAGVKAIRDAYNESLDTSKFDSFQTRVKQALQDQKDASKAIAAEAAKPTLNYEGKAKAAKGGGKKDNSAAQEAKAQLASDLADIKNMQKEITDGYANQEKVLEAMRSAGLTDEAEYYRQKNDLLQKNVAAQAQAQQDTIARLEKENLSGKDAIDNAKQIAAAQSALNKIQADGATQAQILGIQEEAAYRKTAAAILAARQAAQDFFDTTNQGYASMLAGIGKGSKNRDFDTAIQQINEKYQQARQNIANQRAQAELSGPLGPTQAAKFEADLAIQDEFQAKALDSYRAYYASLTKAQDDWKNGATEALKNYADESANTAKLTEDAFSSAFKGLEDVLVDFVKTGKLNFKSLADSIIADFLRIAIRQQITGPLASGLSSAIGGSGNGFGGLLSSLFGNGTGNFGSASAVGSSLNFWGGGYTGAGGKYDPAGIVHKGEYVLTAEQTKAIGVNNLKNGNFGGGFQQSNTFIIPSNVTRDTQTQIANKLRRETNTAAARFGQT